MFLKKWDFTPLDKTCAAELAENCEIHPFLALLLTTRGITTPEDATAFLTGQDEGEDPYAFADMDKAVDRLNRALEQGEKVEVYGDYDVDGITATILLYTYLQSRGADVCYELPLRENGYGLHEDGIRRAAEKGVTLLVTVDTGISLTQEETALAKALGMDIVITDHHQPPAVLPDAVAVVDPHRQDCGSICKDFAGVGVAFMLLCALDGDAEKVLGTYGDLLTLGTLADAMPLRGFMRDLVRHGLVLLNESTRPGIVALRRVAGYDKTPLTATSVAYTLVPRLNAAGRMKDPDLALRLLLTGDEETAGSLAEELQKCNVQRQTVGQEIWQEVQRQLEDNPQWLWERVLVVSGKNWHNGLLGIVAARLCETFGKPAFILSEGEDGTVHGSARSLQGFSLYRALENCAEDLMAFGGHEMAAGVTLAKEKVDSFREKVNGYAARECPQMPVESLSVALPLRPEQIDVEKLQLMEALGPFGNGNPPLLFGLSHMELTNITAIGGGKHLRLSLKRDDTVVSAVKFNTAPADFPIPCGSVVNCIVAMERNEYRGTVSVSIQIKDIGYASANREEWERAFAGFERMMRREAVDNPRDCLPTREQLTQVYTLLHRCGEWNGTPEQLGFAVSRVNGGNAENPITPMALLVAVEVLKEANLISFRDKGETIQLKQLPSQGKADLTATALWQWLEGGNVRE